MSNGIPAVRETWNITNISNIILEVTDLPLFPKLSPGQTIDGITYYTRERLSASFILGNYVSRGLVTMSTWDHTHDDKADVGHFIATHGDTTATGAQLNVLTEGITSDASSLHTHTGLSVLTAGPTSDADALHTHDIEGVSAHNDLTGIQGGTTDEYYHLTSAETTALTTGVNADIYHAHTLNVGITDVTATATEINQALDGIGETVTDTNLTTLTDGSNADVLHTHSGGSIVDHNDLTGLQGGTTDEYYHLTSSEHTELIEWLDDVVLSTDGSMDIVNGSFTTTGIITGGTIVGINVTSGVDPGHTHSGGSIVDHNDLTGLQGGTTDEYYHLTSSEHTELTDWLDNVVLLTNGSMNIVSGSFTTTGLGTFGNLDVDTLNLNGNVISDSTGTISFADENLTTTGTITGGTIIGINVTSGVDPGHTHSSGSIADHNDLTGLQGGMAAQYYHLTSSEHTELTDWLDNVELLTNGSMNIGAGDFTTTGDIRLVSNANRLEVGALAGGNLQIYHDGSHSYITNSTTGSLYIDGNDSVLIDPENIITIPGWDLTRSALVATRKTSEPGLGEDVQSAFMFYMVADQNMQSVFGGTGWLDTGDDNVSGIATAFSGSVVAFGTGIIAKLVGVSAGASAFRNAGATVTNMIGVLADVSGDTGNTLLTNTYAFKGELAKVNTFTNAYGLHLEPVTGASGLNYAIYTQGGDIAIAADGTKLLLGANGDSYIEFDTNSMKIVANAQLGTDNLEITANLVDLGATPLTTTGIITGINVTSGVDPGHTHSGGSIDENTLDHNLLDGLQGGFYSTDETAHEYYHLDLTEYTELTAWLDDVVLSTDGSMDISNGSFTTTNTITGEQITSTDDIDMAGILTNIMGATDTQGFFFDGDTNPYTSTASSILTDITRTYVNSGVIYNYNVIGQMIYLTNQVVETGVANDHITIKTTAMNSTVLVSGLHDLTFSPSKTLNETNTGMINFVSRGGLLTSEETVVTNIGLKNTITESLRYSNAATLSIYNTGEIISIITSGGNPGANKTVTNIGLKISISDNGAAGVVTSYGIFISTITGNTVWGIYDNSGTDWALATDSQKIYFGAVQDSYIEFDGDSMNIVANATTPGDAMEFTAGSYKFKTFTDNDIVVTFFGETNNGIFAWMEDEDYFRFDDGILMRDIKEIYFRDTTTGIYSQATGFLDLFASSGAVRIGDSASGAPTNYTEFTSTGDIKPVGSAEIVIQKATGKGIKVDHTDKTFPYRDLLGRVTSVNTGATKPSHITYRDGLLEFQFAAGDEDYFQFHIPHDYVGGTDIFLHIHWSHIGTLVTGGTITFNAEHTYSKGHDQAAFPASVNGDFNETASTTQYQHMLTEVQLSASSPTGLQLDTDDLEPDGVILMKLQMKTNSITVSSGGVPDPFIHYVDIHYRSTNIGTKDKVPDFYT